MTASSTGCGGRLAPALLKCATPVQPGVSDRARTRSMDSPIVIASISLKWLGSRRVAGDDAADEIRAEQCLDVERPAGAPRPEPAGHAGPPAEVGSAAGRESGWPYV